MYEASSHLLAGAGGSDQRHPLMFLDRERDVGECVPIGRVIGKAHLLESDAVGSRRQGGCCGLAHLARGRQQFGDGRNVASSTNLWGGLQEGLEFKSLVYGDRYDSNIDEVFLLSDGAPTEGEVVDPSEILSLIQESYRFNKVRINTVFISSPQDRRPRGRGRRLSMTGPEVLMRRIAETTGGTFVNR